MLRRGIDFDRVVLAVSLGMLEVVAQELIADRPEWRDMTTHVRTIGTLGLQIWLRADHDELGMAAPAITTSGYIPPIDTFSSMPPQTLWPRTGLPPTIRGRWPTSAGALDVDWTPDGDQDAYVRKCSHLAETEALNFLDNLVGGVHLPGAVTEHGFAWHLLAGADGQRDAEALATQHLSVNIDPSDRYVLSIPPGTDDYRLRPDESGYDNLVLAGDWTDSGLNSGVHRVGRAVRSAGRQRPAGPRPVPPDPGGCICHSCTSPTSNGTQFFSVPAVTIDGVTDPPGRNRSAIDEMLDRAVRAINSGDRATADALAGRVLAFDHANVDAEELLAAPADHGELRRITILFADLVDSTALSTRIEPETYRTVVGHYRDEVIRLVNEYEGHIGNTKGDGLLAVFGHPIAHEDDVRRAVQSGLDITRAVARLSERVQRRFGFDIDVRVGIHRGLVYLDTAQDDVYGFAANLAARMCSIAEPGTVAVSEAVERLIRDTFHLERGGAATKVKGGSRPRSSRSGWSPNARYPLPQSVPWSAVSARCSTSSRPWRWPGPARCTFQGGCVLRRSGYR